MKRLVLVIVAVLTVAGLLAGCGSTKTLVKKEVVYVKVPVVKPCPDPGPHEDVEYRQVKFVPPSHPKAAACLTWRGLKNILANMAACRGALARCRAKLNVYRRHLGGTPQ